MIVSSSHSESAKQAPISYLPAVLPASQIDRLCAKSLISTASLNLFSEAIERWISVWIARARAVVSSGGIVASVTTPRGILPLAVTLTCWMRERSVNASVAAFAQRAVSERNPDALAMAALEQLAGALRVPSGTRRPLSPPTTLLQLAHPLGDC